MEGLSLEGNFLKLQFSAFLIRSLLFSSFTQNPNDVFQYLGLKMGIFYSSDCLHLLKNLFEHG